MTETEERTQDDGRITNAHNVRLGSTALVRVRACLHPCLLRLIMHKLLSVL